MAAVSKLLNLCLELLLKAGAHDWFYNLLNKMEGGGESNQILIREFAFLLFGCSIFNLCSTFALGLEDNFKKVTR